MSELNSATLTMSGLEDAETVYGVFGVCRSGTTAIEKLLALGGVPAYHQPIKTSLLQGTASIDLAEYRGDESSPSHIAIKETLGAYSMSTSTFNPLATLRANVPDVRLHTVFTVKHPFYNFLSWINMVEMAPPKSGRHIGTEELLDNYILASQTLFSVFEESRDADIATTVFDYESLREKSGDAAARRLLSDLGINSGTYSQSSWSSTGSVRGERSGIIHITAPSANPLHDRLDASSGLQYFAPDLQQLPVDLHADTQNRLANEGLYDNYAQMLAH